MSNQFLCQHTDSCDVWHADIKHTNHIAPSGLENLTELQIFLQPYTNLPPASGGNLAGLEMSHGMARNGARTEENQETSLLATRRGIVLNYIKQFWKVL